MWPLPYKSARPPCHYYGAWEVIKVRRCGVFQWQNLTAKSRLIHESWSGEIYSHKKQTETWVKGLKRIVHTQKKWAHTHTTGIKINTNIHTDSESGTHIHMHTQWRTHIFIPTNKHAYKHIIFTKKWSIALLSNKYSAEFMHIRGPTIKFGNSPPCACRGSTGQKP